MPQEECYLEVGTLEGRTLDAAAVGNETKKMYGVDKCEKYGLLPEPFPPNVRFVRGDIKDFIEHYPLTEPIGLCFYDADHSAEATKKFMWDVMEHLAEEAVLVLDDWDRESVRNGAFGVHSQKWRLLREMPEYGDGLTAPCAHFGYSFGISIWGYRK